MAEILLVDRRDGYAVVTLNRPEAMNALSRALRAEIARAFRELEADEAVRVAILTGAGRAFCAGLDLKELTSGERDPAEAVTGWELMEAIGAFGGPLIGAVNGHAITGGFELALACDVLVASTAARFADTHARVGILPGWGLSQKLPRLIGINRAKELSFTGNFLGPTQAEAWGLVNRVVPPEELLPTAEALARDMLSCDPASLRGYKRVIDEGYGLPFAEGMALEARRCAEHVERLEAGDLARRRDAVQARGREQTGR